MFKAAFETLYGIETVGGSCLLAESVIEPLAEDTLMTLPPFDDWRSSGRNEFVVTATDVTLIELTSA